MRPKAAVHAAKILPPVEKMEVNCLTGKKPNGIPTRPNTQGTPKGGALSDLFLLSLL